MHRAYIPAGGSAAEQQPQGSPSWISQNVYVPIVAGLGVLLLLLTGCGVCVLPLCGITVCALPCSCC